ncbi:MAG TPA: 6-carboxytetrahydropterin synthase, partial [Elusimicrobiota bacterium]|nr:6-carboxytetrahydropterin synthase [Elusimicrobiota bacterium]
MFKVVREIHFCYGHRLMNYAGKCRHPHGHNGRVEVEVSARKLDPRGMVVDFGDIKSRLQSWI